jgi:hypothetical protein
MAGIHPDRPSRLFAQRKQPKQSDIIGAQRLQFAGKPSSTTCILPEGNSLTQSLASVAAMSLVSR